MESGKETSGRAPVSKSGLMELNMRANGSITKPKGKESSHTLMVTFMTEIGNRTRHQAMEYIFTTTAPDTKANGSMTTNTVMVFKPG